MQESTNPTTHRNQKQSFHPRACVIQPMIGANNTSAKYCDELKIAEAVPRSAAGNHAATIRPFPGKTGDCASPDTSLKPSITMNTKAAGRYPAKPTRAPQIDQQTMLTPYTRFDPKESSSPPAGNWPAT